MNSLIGTKEAAERLHISVRRVQALIAAGRLPAERIGNSFAISESDLNLVKKRKNGRPQPARTSPLSKSRFARFAGSVEDDLPRDLSSNKKKYLDGFGT